MQGMDLKVERIRAGVLQQDLAAALGVARQTVIAWERSQFVAAEKADRYLLALSGLSRTSRKPLEPVA